jgi:topoisomerase IA-like protein
MATPKMTNVNLDSLVDEIAADILQEKSKQTQKKKKTSVQFITNLQATASKSSETIQKAA